MLRQSLLLSLALGAVPPPAALALEWKSKVFEATTAPFQSTVEAVFEFKNRTGRPVTILAVETTCDCVAATGEHQTYQPGETGRIQATFTVGDRVGLYERSISVKADDDPQAPVRLLLRVNVPDLIDITPRMAYWRTGEAAEEKILEIKINGPIDLHLDGVYSITQTFDARLENIVAGKHYRLRLKPRSTTQPASDALRIHGATTDGRALVFSAYAYVK